MSDSVVPCYNKGCGKSFDPSQNFNDSCSFHPGNPYFHDAYKGWSCCNKKSTDFTEFLNMKGCAISSHNPNKPAEPERPVPNKDTAKEVIEVRAPEPAKAMERPNIDTPMVLLKPTIAQSLLNQLKEVKLSSYIDQEDTGEAIPVGTNCKNNGCKQNYESVHSLNIPCTYHPGVPVFHEGLKFWTCCTRKTTDFGAFLEQEGCAQGEHLWFKKKTDKGVVKCRLDWHQTSSSVVVSIFAKKYDPHKSKVQISPIRLKVDLYFPEEDGSYQQDIELRGIVNVDKCNVSMFGTKVEIVLNKAEVGSWPNLEIIKSNNALPKVASEEEKIQQAQHALDTVDLSEL